MCNLSISFFPLNAFQNSGELKFCILLMKYCSSLSWSFKTCSSKGGHILFRAFVGTNPIEHSCRKSLHTVNFSTPHCTYHFVNDKFDMSVRTFWLLWWFPAIRQSENVIELFFCKFSQVFRRQSVKLDTLLFVVTVGFRQIYYLFITRSSYLKDISPKNTGDVE